MGAMINRAGLRVAMMLLLPGCGWGQVAAPVPSSQTAVGESVPAVQGTVLDRVVAVVNGDLVLESDVDEEKRFLAFQPFRSTAAEYSRERAIDRLIDRTLILQQAQIQQEEPIKDEAVAAQLAALRKEIPECKVFHCETDGGWQKFVEAQGFSVAELTERWRERMAVLKFIEVRFRMGIRISDEEIKDYYDKTLLPQYAEKKTVAPKLETISNRIQEILLQQQVGNLLGDWLKALRVQGTVRIMKPGEVAP